MQQVINSPLLPVREVPGTDGQMRLLDLLGCAVDLLRHTDLQARQALGAFVENVHSAAKDGRIHLALDEGGRPFGLAIWQWVDKETHEMWLRNERTQGTQRKIVAEVDMAGSELWFSVFLTPFSSSEPLVEQLRKRLPSISAAWSDLPDETGSQCVWKA